MVHFWHTVDFESPKKEPIQIIFGRQSLILAEQAAAAALHLYGGGGSQSVVATIMYTIKYKV